jgi:hypothetical protein
MNPYWLKQMKKYNFSEETIDWILKKRRMSIQTIILISLSSIFLFLKMWLVSFWFILLSIVMMSLDFDDKRREEQ